MSSRRIGYRNGLALLCTTAMCAGMSGCFTSRPPRASIAGKVSLRPPMLPAANSTGLDAAPDVAMGTTRAPELILLRTSPPRPHVAPPPVPETGKPEKQRQPGIAPDFDTQEAQEAKADAQRSLEQVEKNLSLSSGRSLNASQQDLVSKMRGFAENAREAMRTGDWVRAKNLSKKAEVLSEELADSL
jgi:hypothetical protein